MKKIVLGLFICVFILGACGANKEEETVENEEPVTPEVEQLSSLLQFPQAYDDQAPVATFHTSMGDITVVFFPEEAPKAVENLLTHAKEGYYDGILFHRVIQNFMIQGGDPLGTGMGGESIWGQGFEVEDSDQLFHFRGALSMARAGGDRNSNGSQFFIVQAPVANGYQITYPDLAKQKYEEIGGVPSLDGEYTVFGQTIEGIEVVDAIAAVAVDINDKPLEPVTIQSISVTTYGEWIASK